MKQYQVFAIISMVFAGVTSVIAKAGLKNVNSDVGLAVCNSFVFTFIWLNIIAFQQTTDFTKLTRKDILILACSGLTTSLSWIFYYKAMKIGNVSEVALIEKAGIVITLLLSFAFLHEQFTLKIAIGALMILGGLLVINLK